MVRTSSCGAAFICKEKEHGIINRRVDSRLIGIFSTIASWAEPPKLYADPGKNNRTCPRVSCLQ